MAYNFKRGSKYSFDTFAPQILGNEYSAIQIKSILDYEDAAAAEDVRAIHSQVLGYITDPTVSIPKDWTKLTYLKIVSDVGKHRIIAAEWIKEDSIREISEVDCTVFIPGLRNDQADLIAQALSQNGIINFEIQFKER